MTSGEQVDLRIAVRDTAEKRPAVRNSRQRARYTPTHWLQSVDPAATGSTSTKRVMYERNAT